MARIAGVDLPRNKRIEIALRYIFGVGPHRATQIVKLAQVDPNKRTDTLNEDEIKRLREIIEHDYKVEGDLRREVSMNIKRLMDLKSYRGIRHMKHLPVRGQRTRTNSRTRKGRAKPIGMKKGA